MLGVQSAGLRMTKAAIVAVRATSSRNLWRWRKPALLLIKDWNLFEHEGVDDPCLAATVVNFVDSGNDSASSSSIRRCNMMCQSIGCSS